jgi:bis(5'-nucleosyl)-tetraphosphatase (symmetrical)
LALWAIGDLQGCCTEFDQLRQAIGFRPDRDQLWLTGDLVNRGPQSLAALRRVRELGANVVTVLGNHDLHLLALAHVPGQRERKNDTLAEILQAPDHGRLLDWLLERPLLHQDLTRNDVLLHAGLVPQWSAAQAATLAREVEAALRSDPQPLLSSMYGDLPEQWNPALEGLERLRFVINVLTRMRVCTRAGRIDLRQKGPPDGVQPPWLPWFAVPGRAAADSRVICGHWSALGLLRRRDIVALDTGCVWGGALTAVNLDDEEAPPVSVASLQ